MELEAAHDLSRASIEMAMTVTDFWSAVDRSAGPDACHLWTGYVEKDYGKFFFDGKMIGAHELAVLFTTGEIRPRGWDTCHYVCHTPLCCNPKHLRYGTRQDNVDDMTGAGRQARGERNGHSRLTVADVVEIRHRADNGATGRALAAEYGVSVAAVTMIIRGQRWSHAGGPIRLEHGNRKHGKFARRSA